MLEFVERTSQEIFCKLGDVEWNQGKKHRGEVDRRKKKKDAMSFRRWNGEEKRSWYWGENCQDETVIKYSTEYRSLHETVVRNIKLRAKRLFERLGDQTMVII